MNKYPKRKTTRLKEYNYSQSGYYFVTICTYNRQELFGAICRGAISCARNEYGNIVKKYWDEIPQHYPYVVLDKSVIMPNHIHVILVMNTRAQASGAPTISQIIRSFKSKCTNEYLNFITKNDLNISGKIWQRSFHDHIIRNDRSLNNIREYVINNPSKWDDDENNIKNYKLTGQACLASTCESYLG